MSDVHLDAHDAGLLDDLPAQISDITPPSGSRLRLAISFPADAEHASVILRTTDASIVTLAVTLQRDSEIRSLDLGGSKNSNVAEIVAASSASEMATRLRATDTFEELGTLSFARDSYSVEVSQATPSIGALRALDRTGGDHSVSSYQLTIGPEGSAVALIKSSSPASIAKQLRAASVADDPPLRFSVHTSEYKKESAGCIGRPTC